MSLPYDAVIHKYNRTAWLVLALLGSIGAFVFTDALGSMLASWRSAEYSHGYLLPVLTLYFIWQKRIRLSLLPNQWGWGGLALAMAGILLRFAGELGSLYIVEQYAVLIFIYGVVLAFVGWPRFKLIFPALLLLLFAVPLPSFLFNNLSQSLQLISSEIGVQVIRLFGVSVFLEGNVIDLGNFKLQVVDACSGLRYLFPLMALGYIAAYMFKGAWWKRALIFLSTIPITVLMNSFRIGVIGVMVDRWGQAMAEGFLHDFEGWIIFMACAGVLIAEMWGLARIGPHKMALSEAFGLEVTAQFPKSARVRRYPTPGPLWATLVVTGLALGMTQVMGHRHEIAPVVKSYATFPMRVGHWRGKPDHLDKIYTDALKLDDYVLADYVDDEGVAVNLYVAWYATQRKGASVHSPRSCLPGGGWVIESLTQRTFDDIRVAGEPLRVNRTVIQQGDVKDLVYYWFQQRGRVITNEYLVKLFLFWDAITKNRTDGTLVRLTASIPVGKGVAEVDRVLVRFARDIAPVLDQFIPR